MIANSTALEFVAVDFDPFAGPEIVRVAPSTQPQVEIWTSCLVGGDDANRAFNESITLRLKGVFDRSAMEQAFSMLIQRHEALRSGFSADGRYVCVYNELPVPLYYQDLSQRSASEQERLLADYVKGDALHLFNLKQGPLIKAGLFRLAPTEHCLVLTAHHIVCDGWSIGVILQDISALYSAFAQNRTPVLNHAPDFSQYAEEQLRFTESNEYTEIEKFWLDQYKGNVPVLKLPTDFERPALRSFKGRRQDYDLDNELVASLKKTGQKAGCSFVVTLMAAFEVLLHRLTGQDDIIIGLPTAGQAVTDNYGLVGHCVNLLPLRSRPNLTLSFHDYLQQRREAFYDAYEHQQLTFGSLLRKLKLPRDASRVPMVPVTFNIDLGLDDAVEFYGLDYQLISNPREYETFDLFVNATDSKRALTLEWSFNTQLFRNETIDRMMAEFNHLLQAVVANPSTPLSTVLSTGTHQPARSVSSQPVIETVDIRSDETLHQLIAQTAITHPDKPALVFNGKAVSYRELNETANRVAHFLIQKGVKPGDIVGVALERSSDLLITLLAILKSGAAYLPLDPEYPHDRITFMLSDAASRHFITSKKYRGAIRSQATELLIESAIDASASYPADEPKVAVGGDDLAYIIYTSGSTGKPKGVLIRHFGLINVLRSILTEPGVQSDDRWLAVSTISFDMSVPELFVPLLAGATVVLTGTEITKDGRALLHAVNQYGVTIMQATPTTWKMMLASGWEETVPVKVISAGEPLSKDLAQKLLQKCDSLWNLYGPTETTIYATIKQVQATDPVITIGHPIQNYQIFILNEDQQLVPQGTVGELYIGGHGVAKGYLNRPELTTEKFINSPIDSYKGTLYRTGDLGFITNEGEVQCLGRTDYQIKIRGYRIEAGEIERIITAQPGVKEAVVIAREDRPNDQRLTAYAIMQHLLPDSAFNQEVAKWKQALRAELPSFMIPVDYVQMTALPMTLNGKIDRKALPRPNAQAHTDEEPAKTAVTELEKLITTIWTEEIGIKDIGVTDDFFELGGHSLTAVHVMTRLEEVTGKRLPLSTLFEHPTIRQLASILESDKKATTWKSLVPIKPTGSKMPVYLIHGGGLHVLNFNSFAMHMDPEQPVFGLQAFGLHDGDEPLDSMEAIAAFYVSEIMAQNPTGPYAIVGYSFGGYIAVEMARQLKRMGKEVKLLGMMDTDAQSSPYQLFESRTLKQKLMRQVVKSKSIFKSLLGQPWQTFTYQWQYFQQLLKSWSEPVSPIAEVPSEHLAQNLRRINEKHETAYKNYTMKPYEGKIHLFKAEIGPYFGKAFEYLGWEKFAMKGVELYHVSGNHLTMLLPPYDKGFARTLQDALNKC
ncbi:amino acid adenylation domain protein [Fibrisoma limi BUZ 3]|uniref:Amino acid adenylation domain protein n=1 Tax=Fibrisoma limi BUZ 3 TaxID=1185876 RepID=I2GT89_9BACT|nr:non-ribosomal peptide synthetase [Fibrisoma limi]CCH57118.1 amino acid adenylation domain protein [Fibrisoma limi BUZ 3]